MKRPKFGELRSAIHSKSWDQNQRILKLVLESHLADPERHRDEWVPYLQDHPDIIEKIPTRAKSLAELKTLYKVFGGVQRTELFLTEVSCNGSDPDFEEFLHREEMRSVNVLIFNTCWFSKRGAELLAEAPNFDNLHTLSFERSLISLPDFARHRSYQGVKNLSLNGQSWNGAYDLPRDLILSFPALETLILEWHRYNLYAPVLRRDFPHLQVLGS